MPKAVLIKTTLVDYPARVAAACFLQGCNLRCPYCYNTELVLQKEECLKVKRACSFSTPIEFVTIEEIISHLQKRKNLLTGLVISGGEPLCAPETVRKLIGEARALNYKIKLDTNGTFPEQLESLIKDSSLCPDYIALDVKTSPVRYGELASTLCGKQHGRKLAEKITDSIKIISQLPEDRREFRTVLYPPLVGKKEIEEIASLLPKNAAWYFAQFRNDNCISPDAENTLPYTDIKVSALVKSAAALIPGAKLR